MRKDRCCHNRLIEVRRVTQERQAGSERLGSSERRKEKTQGYRQKTQQPVPTNSYLAMTDVLPGSHARTPEPELRLVLLGTIGCGKTLSGDTLLGQSSSGSPSSSSSSPRLCQLRPGASEGRRLTVVEAPRWYWSGGHMEAGVRKETERALELAAPGPHAFLLLVPVGQFTEVEHRVPAELEEVFGEGVLKHTLVLFTCGDYLMGQGAGQYLEGEDPGLREVIDRCGGQYHVLNNRRPQDREQVRELLEKVENMVQKNRGCYIRQNTLQREMEEQARGRERELKEKVEEQARERERELKEKVEEQARERERELKEKVEEQARGRERELKEKVEEQARERERELKEKVEEQARERERELKEKVEEQARGRERELKEKVEEQARERERELKRYKVEEKETVLESRHVTNTETRRYCGSQKREVTPNSAIERRREEEREESEEMENWKEEMEKIKKERDEIMKSRKEKEEMERKIEEEWEKRRKDEMEKRRKRRGRERELKEKVEEQARGRERELKEKVEEQARGRERELKEKVEEQERGRERELKEKVEEQARERERELKEKVEEQARGRERELKEKVEEQARERERELKEKVEEQARERERELKEKVEEQARGRERELKEKVEEQARERERELKEKVEEQARERERELKEKVEEQARGRERELKEKVEEQARGREGELESRHVTNTETRRYWGNRKREVTPNSAIERRREEEREEMERKREEEIERRRREEGEDMEEKVTVKPLVNCLQSTPTQQQQPKKPQNGGPALFTRIPSFHLTEVSHKINSIEEKTTPSSSSSQSELRVVLLGRSGSGKSAAGNIILGREEFVSRPDITTAVTQDCQKSRALVAGRRVAVVDTPDWFRSEHPPDVVRSKLSSCVALSAPGPHAFILCVPVDQPAQAELQALGALEKVFGPGAVRTHTLVLFTHSDRLKESGKVGVEGVEKYISSQRRDLLELVKRCGDRYHVMERGSGGEEEEERKRRSVGELLEKVEQTVREGGGECFSCPLFQEAEDRVRQRQEEIVRERRGRGEEVKRQALHSYSMQPLRETEEDEEENERTREEAEKSVSALELENLPSLSSSSAWYSSLLRSVWEKVGAGASKVPKLTAGGALLGGVVGVFFGGPIGGAIGATAGSVVTEVGRRRFSQTKNSAEETDATGRIEGEILDKVLKTE
ncbi:uncharacterized protein LOC109876405 isoform X2 [Oncorhynchus kisutch]|uniref:Plectin-like n=1 Tax=Oncorhynchus kisutch TaxID=8019 RepID=A0A8C7GXU5_ONCKI|nr:uncharacterized protein LOC109876405 isoform X2 [Oncorhynchus kisutch]